MDVVARERFKIKMGYINKHPETSRCADCDNMMLCEYAFEEV